MANSAKDGEVLYTIRADDSQLDSDLDAAEKKVRKSSEEAAEKSEQAEKESADVKKKVKEDVTEHHRKENEKQEQSDEESHDKREESAKSHGETLKNIASGTAKAIGTGMLAAGAAVVGIGVSAVSSANDMDKAMNQFVASTGKGTEETERYKKVMEEIYSNNYGDSFEDIGQAMADVTQKLGDLDDVTLQNVTESAFALRDTFGYEIPESTRAAKAMMDNFGISGEQAMNLIAAGAQNGLDYSGELLDSIIEYSVQFAKVGLDADDMFKIFQKGAESGAFNLDKVGDAVKEMAIRVVDGSDTTAQGFELIGLNADEMAAKFAAGGDSAKEAFNQTIEALAGLEDPLAQNTAGVDLFGTMWEDLGPEAVTALADIQEGAYDTAGAMEQIKDIKYDDISSVFEGLKRSVEVLIVPLGEQLIPLLAELIDEVLPLIEENLPPLVELIAQFAEQLIPIAQEILPVLLETITALGEPLMQIIEAILPVLLELFTQIAPLLGELVEAVLPILLELFQALIPPLIEIISAALPPLIELVTALLPIFQTLIDLLMPIIELFVELMGPIVSLISDALVPLLEALQPIVEFITSMMIPILEMLLSVFQSVFEGIVTDVMDHIDRITDLFNNLVDFVKNIFAGNWEAALENLGSILGDVFGGFASIIKRPINACIDVINGFIGGINRIRIPDWVPGIGGASPNIPKIPRLKIGMDYVPGDFYPAYLDEGEAVLTKEENRMYRDLGGLQGMYAMKQVRDTGSSVEIPGLEGLDEKIAEAIHEELEGLGIYMDSKPVGKLVTPTVNEELGKLDRRKT